MMTDRELLQDEQIPFTASDEAKLLYGNLLCEELRLEECLAYLANIINTAPATARPALTKAITSVQEATHQINKVLYEAGLDIDSPTTAQTADPLHGFQLDCPHPGAGYDHE